MQAADPVRIGLVESFNRPCGNLTGINLMWAEVAGKRFELLLELVPTAKSIAYLGNPTNPVFAESEARELQTAARAHAVRLFFVNASRPSDFESAFAEIVQQRADALVVRKRGFSSYRPRSNRCAGGQACGASDLRLAPVNSSRRSDQLCNEPS
jgi:putative ABC transport system substrate-binding protein